MFTFAVGITIITVGILWLVWSGVFNNRRTTNPIREQLEAKGQTDRNIEQSIARAESTVESLSDGIRAEDKRIEESVGRISEASAAISESNKTDREIFERIRNQKLSD